MVQCAYNFDCKKFDKVVQTCKQNENKYKEQIESLKQTIDKCKKDNKKVEIDYNSLKKHIDKIDGVFDKATGGKTGKIKKELTILDDQFNINFKSEMDFNEYKKFIPQLEHMLAKYLKVYGDKRGVDIHLKFDHWSGTANTGASCKLSKVAGEEVAEMATTSLMTVAAAVVVEEARGQLGARGARVGAMAMPTTPMSCQGNWTSSG